MLLFVNVHVVLLVPHTGHVLEVEDDDDEELDDISRLHRQDRDEVEVWTRSV